MKAYILLTVSLCINIALAEPAYTTLLDRVSEWGYKRYTGAMPEQQSIEGLLSVHMPKVDGVN